MAKAKFQKDLDQIKKILDKAHQVALAAWNKGDLNSVDSYHDLLICVRADVDSVLAIVELDNKKALTAAIKDLAAYTKLKLHLEDQ